MFTGIIQTVGSIDDITPLGSQNSGLRLRVHANTLNLADVTIGDSIALNGACMTVTSLDAPYFTVEVSQVSLQATTGLDQLGLINLEKALRVGDYVGGHFVSGHVDGIGIVHNITPLAESHCLEICVPSELAPFVAKKGSVVINGVSLTINEVIDITKNIQTDNSQCIISINLIAHTWAVTTLSQLKKDSFVNIEIDLIARYLQRSLLFFNPSTH